ncbi:MAG: diguanylate cyclase [Oscillospiraceae bacterium]|jgi:diguanylate cyclase (GGDEF)-like protein|nr:diguanylate cyclase [Oscillospiraceae bacterium]
MEPESKKTNRVNETLMLPLYPAFADDLPKFLAGLDASDAPCVTLAMLDVDNMLRLNEQYGYAAVDDATIAMVLHFQRQLPEGARIYRYSGDCFVIILPAVEKEEAFLLMEQLRKEMAVAMPDGTAYTVSIGIATAPADGATFSEFVRKADAAMYRAKTQGKNRICLAREEKMVTKTSHYTPQQLQKLTELSKRLGIGEAVLLREALDVLLQKYDGMRHAGE